MRLLFLCVLLFGTLCAEIQELNRFSDLEKHLTKDTLLILDIDDTLLIPAQMLGSDAWFCHRWNQRKETCDSEEALEKTLAEWEAVRHLTQMRVVEPGTEAIITSLQERGFPMMALTTQGLALATRTYQQLAQNGFVINKTAPVQGDCYLLVDAHGVLYRKGVLYTSGMPKGKSFFAFCDKMKYAPKRVVFVNDKKTHLQDVEEVAKERGVEFLGLRYAYADHHKALFSPNVAEYQYKYSSFDRILSDEEAMEQMLPPPG